MNKEEAIDSQSKIKLVSAMKNTGTLQLQDLKINYIDCYVDRKNKGQL